MGFPKGMWDGEMKGRRRDGVKYYPSKLKILQKYFILKCPNLEILFQF